MRVEVTRSAKRRKTVQARLVDGVVHVSLPARMTEAEEERWVAEMVGRFERRRSAEPIDLAARAEVLAVRHRLPVARSIRWVDNQQWRWGSCTPADGSVRISTRVARLPGWVLDYVIVHELAHLAVPGHGPRFWALVERYPRTERARGYLMAIGVEGEGDDPAAPPVRPVRPRPAGLEPPAAAHHRPPAPTPDPAPARQTLW